MKVDADLVDALADGMNALREEPAHPVPVAVIEALAYVALPGRRVSIDLEASARIGAPLITVTEAPAQDKLFAPLTRRQREVAACLVAGQSNQEIAQSLGISLATVKDHVHAILDRLDLPSRAAVIAASLRSKER